MPSDTDPSASARSVSRSQIVRRSSAPAKARRASRSSACAPRASSSPAAADFLELSSVSSSSANASAEPSAGLRAQSLDVEGVGDGAGQADRVDELAMLALLDGLDPDRRAAFVLTQVVGCGYGETAEILGVPVGTVRSRVARAREHLIGELRRSVAR